MEERPSGQEPRPNEPEALPETSDRFRQLFEDAPLGYQSLDADGKIIMVNLAWLKLLGFTHDEVVGRPFSDFLAPGGAELFRERFPLFKERGETHNVEFDMVQKDGKTITVSFEGRISRDPDGSVRQTHCILTDITERRRAQEELELAPREWQATFDSLTDATCIIDLESVIQRCNGAMSTIFGKIREQIIGRLCCEIVHGTKEPLPDCPVQKMKRSLRREYIEFRFDGRWLEVAANPIFDGSGALKGAVHIVRDITLRKKAEEKNTLLATMVDASPVSITVHDFDGKFLYANDRTLQMHGYTREDFLALDLGELDMPETAALIAERMKEIREKGAALFEVRHRRKDGTTFPLLVHAKLVQWEGRQVILSMATDISEKKRAEESMRVSEERFRKMFEEGPLGMAISAMDLRFVAANEMFCRIVGYSADELKRLTFRELTHKDDGDMDVKGIRELDNGERTVYRTEKRYVRKDGAEIWGRLSVSLLHDAGGRAVHHLVMLVDITALKRLEGAIEESEEWNRSLVENTSEGILLTAPDGRILSANPAACRMLGRTEEEICRLGRDGVADTSDPRLEAAVEERARTGKFRGELTFVRQDGTKFPAEVSSTIFELPGGEKRTVIIINDITERKRAEAALQEAKERLEIRVEERTCELELANRTLREEMAERLRATDAVKAERKQFYDVLETLPAYLLLLTPDHHVPFANRFFRERFGESQGRRCFEYLFKRNEPCENCMTYDALNNMAPLEWDWTGPDGHNYHVYDFPFKDTDGSTLIMEMGIDVTERMRAEEDLRRHKEHFERMVGERTADLEMRNVQLANEVAERKHAENALRESEEKFRNLAEQSPNMIFIQMRGRVVYANRRCEELLGYKREELYSPDFDFFRLVAPEFRNLNAERYGAHLSGRDLSPYEYAVVGKNGKRIDAILSTRRIFFGGEPAMLGMITDISERKRSELALKNSEQKYRELFENAQIGMYRSRIDGSAFIEVNRKMAEIFGFSREELLRAPSISRWADPSERDRVLAILKERGGTLVNYRTRMLTKNGEIKDVEASFKLHEKEGFIEGTTADITEQKRAADALQESEQRYRSLFENMQEGYAYCRMKFDDRGHPVDWTYLDVSGAFGRITGLENVVGKSVLEVLPNIKETNPELFELYGRVARTGKPESKEVNVSGLEMKTGWLNISVFCPAKGDFVAVFSDITGRKKAELAMRRALMRYELEEGRVYLVVEGDPRISFEAFRDLLKAGYDGFVVTRVTGAGLELWQELRCTVVPLSAKAGKGALPPDAEELERWAESLAPGKAVLFDRLDYLVTGIGFKKTILLVHRLGEIAHHNGHIILLSVDPATLEAKEVRLLEKEGRQVEPLVRESVPEDLLETMKYIYEKNIAGVRPTLASVGRDLGLSQPTVRKRMRELLHLGYIVSHAKGSAKTLELTEKGRAVFLR